jgi:hypothetical protein
MRELSGEDRDLSVAHIGGHALFQGLMGVRASFEPRHGEEPTSWRVVNKRGCTQPAGGSRASPSDLWTLRAQPQLLHRSCNKADIAHRRRGRSRLVAKVALASGVVRGWLG